MPSIAGPKRPQDRVLVAHAKQGFREALRDFVLDRGAGRLGRISG